MVLKDTWVQAGATLRRWLGRAIEAHILFPAIAVVGLTFIWGTTWNRIEDEHSAARLAAVASSHELAETYEAQVVRVLREIDQALKLVKYAYTGRNGQALLKELKSRTLLPPHLLFTVSIADDKGNVVASTHPYATTSVAGEDYFESQLETDTISVGRPYHKPASAEWSLPFSRELEALDGTFAGVVMISVDAAYFVSGYEVSKLGRHGVLGLLGTDGLFRALRSGEHVSAGDTVDFTAFDPAANQAQSGSGKYVPADDTDDHFIASAPVADKAQSEVPFLSDALDGVIRYTSVRKLYGFPLAVIVGLSAKERLQAAQQNMRTYLWRAAGASALLLLVVTVLGQLSRKLATSRLRAVEEHIAHAARVEYLAYHDRLTKLPNRSLFSKLLMQSLSQANRYKRHLAVLFLDLDRFKQINDTLGHDAGDQLLQEVAARLRSCLRDSDTVARLGGDEFVVLLPELDEEKYAANVARKILSAVARPFVLAGQDYRITASIGISTYPQDGLDEQTLTKSADVAMYKAKEEGKNNFQFYSEALNANSLERLTMESALRNALERGEFELHYQVERALAGGGITGMEALLRWRHPDLGTVAPMQFIPLAEETGLIVPIGKWVLRTACLQNVAWQNQGLPRLRMAVNLTARQFTDELLLPDIAVILSDTGMDATLLELEISENLLMHNVDKTLRILGGLKDMGVRIAVDDFGIGYFSIATLKRFPLDTIKIDRSFIRGVTSACEDRNLTGAIIAMGRSLSLNVVAQGVETKEQTEFLRRNDCDDVQGFYLDKPLPAAQIAELLRARSRAVVEGTAR
jgi:diguanylate cyclase (GGDEF)-like protein